MRIKKASFIDEYTWVVMTKKNGSKLIFFCACRSCSDAAKKKMQKKIWRKISRSVTTQSYDQVTSNDEGCLQVNSREVCPGKVNHGDNS